MIRTWIFPGADTIYRALLVDHYHDGHEMHRGNTCILVENGRIARIFTFDRVAEVHGRIGKDCEILDFRGMLATPGLIDSHNHFTLTALKMLFQVDLGDSGSFAGIRKKLAGRNSPEEEWILGYNLNEYTLSEKRLPTAGDLDMISSSSPLAITHSSEHSIICNSRAMEIAGIGAGSQDPPGSRIGRHANGEPNGIMYESAAMDLIKSRIPEYSLEDYVKAISHASAEYRRNGLTSVKDIGGTGNDVNEERRVDAMNILGESGELQVRVGLTIPVYSLPEVDHKISLSGKVNENEHVRFTGFKMFLDGSALQRTGWMKDEWNIDYYRKDEGNFGMPLWNLDDFRKALARLASVGPTVSIHTIGDKAVSEAISMIEELGPGAGKECDFAFVHANSPDPDDIPRLPSHRISVETQACDMYLLGHAYLGNAGPERGKSMFPLRTMLEAGVNLCNGSDSPVMRYEPVYGILSSMRREMRHKPDYDGHFNPTETLTLEETLRTYTENCSRVMHWPGIGGLKEGMLADIAIWRRMPETFDEDIDPGTIFGRVIFSGS